MYFGTIDYVHKLVKAGERAKVKAFWEYCYDMEFQSRNIDYASSWGVDEKTVNEWLSEFYAVINDEIQSSRSKQEQHTKAL